MTQATTKSINREPTSDRFIGKILEQRFPVPVEQLDPETALIGGMYLCLGEEAALRFKRTEHTPK